jgi:uncharacterized membrane protein
VSEGDQRPDTDEAARAGRDAREMAAYALGRVLALSDGVFAIAMTLLVLGIPVPKVPDHASPAQVLGALGDIGGSLFGFTLSFLLVGAIWVEHRQLFSTIRRAGAGSAWMNIIVLLLVCLVPFSTSFYTKTDSGVVGACVYYGTLLVAYGALLALDVQANAADARSGAPPQPAWGRRSHTAATVVGFGAAIAVSVIHVEWATLAWLLAVVANFLVEPLNRMLRRDLKPDAPRR